MKKTLLVFLAIVVLAGAGWGMGTVPPMMNFQGRLIDTSGAPVPGDATVTFRIYDNENIGGGRTIPSETAPWSEAYTASEMGIDSQGIINANLGSRNPIDPNWFIVNVPYYLDVEVNGTRLGIDTNGDGTPDKRQRLVSVPFAFNAQNIINNGSANNYVIVSSNLSDNIIYVERRSDATASSKPVIQAKNSMTTRSTNNIAIQGVSEVGIGVAGTSNSINYGVLGSSAGGFGVYGYSTGGFGVGGAGAVGIWGHSQDRPLSEGVLGTSNQGWGVAGIVSSEAKSGVAGMTSDAPIPTDTNAGVAGSSNTGNGVYGQTNATTYYKAGVYGFNSGAGKGVMGWSNSGIGVFGQSGADYAIWGRGVRGGVVGTTKDVPSDVTDFGVYGKGLFGVVARGADVSGVGLIATGGNFGVSGGSTGGVGVKGESGSTGNAGVLANNTGGGPALEIDNGKFKIRGAYAEYINSSTPVIANAISGRIHNTTGTSRWVGVTNSMVKASDIIIATCQNERGDVGVRDVRDGAFSIWVGAYDTMAFLVISQ